MTNQQIKEQVGKHLFYMVASQMGCKVSEPNLDNGVDFLMMPVRVFENPNSSRFLDAGNLVALQLKCTTKKQVYESEKFIKFDLEVKNYNDLVNRFKARLETLHAKVPLILILIVFNEEGQILFQFYEEEVNVKANIYFYYPENGLALSSNKFSIRIRIPKENKLSFENFRKILEL